VVIVIVDGSFWCLHDPDLWHIDAWGRPPHLNRLEHGTTGAPTRYHRIGHDAAAIESLFVALFLDAHRSPPKQIVLDLDATDDPLHGHQEGRFFHGYYDCWCYLPLYVFCGRHLLAAIGLRPIPRRDVSKADRAPAFEHRCLGGCR
jgi:hypothetical protein